MSAPLTIEILLLGVIVIQIITIFIMRHYYDVLIIKLEQIIRSLNTIPKIPRSQEDFKRGDPGYSNNEMGM